MCKTIDLHTHSYCSDGTFSPEGLVILAKKQGLSAIALTDHDTIDGLELFLEAGEKHGIETICGIEFAALYEGFHRPEIHIVGLGFDRHDPMLLKKLEEIRQSRDDRNERMAKQLTAIGLPVSLEEVAHNRGRHRSPGCGKRSWSLRLYHHLRGRKPGGGGNSLCGPHGGLRLRHEQAVVYL